MSKNMYLDLHVIQTVPPSCVNRDDTGSPKTAIYGGTMRARVSSQAWKRAMRIMFRDLFASEYIGYRTRNTVNLVAKKIRGENSEISEEAAEKIAAGLLEMAGAKASGDKKDVLFFISQKQVENVADLAEEYQALGSLKKEEKKKQENLLKNKVSAALIKDPSIDILLFGRMAASNPALNYDAAAQVAHSISTHTISNEYDYFTAVDDFGDDDNAGAGHIGTVEFNSSTLYRYATVNIAELASFLTKEELCIAVRGFTESFIRSMPTGKQNTFANRTLPDMVYAVIREDQPVNLAGAFEKPVQAYDHGYVKASETALSNHAAQVYKNYVSEPEKAWIIGEGEGICADRVNIKELLEELEHMVSKYGQNGE